MFSNSGSTSMFFYDSLDGAWSEAAVVARGIDRIEVMGIIKKEGRKRVVAGGKVFSNSVGGGFRDQNRAIFLAFSADDKFATVEVDIISIKID